MNKPRTFAAFNAILAFIVAAFVLGRPRLAAQDAPPNYPQAVLHTPDGDLPVPTPSQAAWEDAELGMFYHFDIEVFDRTRDAPPPAPQPIPGAPGAKKAAGRRGPPLASLPPSIFNPAKLDTDQWLRVARSLGARYAVFTAKHDSGFLMWQSDLYPYGVKQSPWRDGKGDVVKDFLASCRKAAVQPGLYCSANMNSYWTIHHGPIRRSPQGYTGDPKDVQSFLDTDLAMYRDLWTQSGPLFYLWFDGGVNFLGHGIVSLIDEYQPNAVCFNGPAGGVRAGSARWSGNEKGFVNYPSWDTTDLVDDQRNRGPGSPDGKYWLPVETNVPLRYHSWFWTPDNEGQILSLSALLTDYLLSVGRGGNFIINANIDSDGLVPEADARRFAEFGGTLHRWFGQSVAETSGRGDTIELSLPQAQDIDCVMIMEDIRQGQRIREYAIDGRVDGRWRELCSGQSIGHKRIQPFDRTKVDAIRLRATKTGAPPIVSKLAAYNLDFPPPDPTNPATLPSRPRAQRQPN